MYSIESRNRPSEIQPIDFCKDAKTVISMNDIIKSGHPHAKLKMNFALNFTHYIKINV